MTPDLPARRPRGQAAAMMAVTMALIALMVALTLGIGMKAREKVEVQTLADVSAYSGAVVTARTYNAVSLLNRAAVAEMVSMLATQSLLSYGSYYRTMLHAARDEFQREIDRPCANVDPCYWCDRWIALRDAAQAEITRVEAQWDVFDRATNDNIRAQQGDVGAIRAAQVALHNDLMTGQIIGAGAPPLADAIVRRVAQAGDWPGELTALATVNPINQRELGLNDDCDTTLPTPFCNGPASAEIMLDATLGSRFYQLETNADDTLTDTLSEAMVVHLGLSVAVGEEVRMIGFQGSARFVDELADHGDPGTMGVLGEAMEGAMQIAVMSNGCGPQMAGPSQISTFVYTTSIDNADATHQFQYTTAGGVAGSLPPEPLPTHSLSPCPPLELPPCGMWPGYADLNPGLLDPGQRERHLYGQPKVTVAVERNYQVRGNNADPWNLLRPIAIRQGAVETFDNRGLWTAANLDISRQTAVATGLVYYHRMGHWKEPPNFFNPYWRATLVSGAIDLDGNPTRRGTDLRDAAANAPFAQDVIDELAGAGFRGWQ